MRRLAAAAALVAIAGCGGQATSPPGAVPAPSIDVPSPAPPSPPPATPGASPAPPAAPPHVMVIVMENREESAVVGRPDAPYTTSLATDYGLATNWYGVSHPSLPNYLAMI